MWQQKGITLGYSKFGRISYRKGGHPELKGLINVTYISFDVCYDFNRLPKIIESIYLDNSFHYESWSNKQKKSYSISNIIAIYAEVPPEMMNYLDASFSGDIRFVGNYASYNYSIEKAHFRIYATILHYIIKHRLKWECLLILNVQPSTMIPLYELLIQKTVESKLCFQECKQLLEYKY